MRRTFRQQVWIAGFDNTGGHMFPLVRLEQTAAIINQCLVKSFDKLI